MTPYLGENRFYTCPITLTAHDPLQTRHLLMARSSGRLWQALRHRDEAVARLAEPELDDAAVAEAEAKYASATASLVQWSRPEFGGDQFTWAEILEALQLFLEWLDQKKRTPGPSLTLFTPTTSAPGP